MILYQNRRMNWIILEEFEKNGSSQYLLDSIKSNHVKNILRKKAGETIKVIIPNIIKTITKIIQISDDRVLVENPLTTEFHTKLTSEDRPQEEKMLAATRLILPLPRPQTGKKILHLIGCYGVSQVIFLLPQSHNKEFLTSPTYKDVGIWKELKNGMEQSGSYLVPEIKILPLNLKQFIEKNISSLKFALDPKFPDSFYNMDLSYQERINQNFKIDIYLGSESGNTEEDLILLEKYCRVYSLGNTVLRTEYAIANILGILQGKGGRKQ